MSTEPREDQKRAIEEMQKTQALKDRIAASKAQNSISRSVTNFLFGGLKDISCLCGGESDLKYLT